MRDALYGLSSVLAPSLLTVAILWFSCWHARADGEDGDV